MYLSGEFQNRDSIIRALQDLQANGVGVGPDDLDVFSDEPLELPRHAIERQTHMSMAVVTGAIISCLLVIGFVYFTQHNYPLITGGMPIFSFWATGVVFYELTMFGAIVTTVFWFLRESGLLRRNSWPPAPVFEPGLICLRVHCHPDQEDGVRRLLETAGGSNFKTWSDTP